MCQESNFEYKIHVINATSSNDSNEWFIDPQARKCMSLSEKKDLLFLSVQATDKEEIK
jgi:hypothetical protein